MTTNYLLDTHIVLWFLADERALSKVGRTLLGNPSNKLFASSVSVWEIAIKVDLGKIDADIDEVCAAFDPSGITTLPFDIADAAAIAALPQIHRDPFDRALIAQARCRGFRFMTADRTVAQYGSDIVCV
jgi:PIN domain nuclease of toxin-antitoxin system